VLLALSLITLISRSTSPMCSRAAVVFNATWGIIVLSFSNSMSINAVCITNPVVAYILNTLSRVCTKCLAVLDCRCFIVTKLKPCDEVTKNGKLFTNITSTTNVTYLCSCTKSQGICTYSTQTHSGFVLVTFPLRLARSGPKIRLVLSMSRMVTGQLVRSCSPTIPANSLSVGFAIMP
jgi:hypothetical protein